MALLPAEAGSGMLKHAPQGLFDERERYVGGRGDLNWIAIQQCGPVDPSFDGLLRGPG